MKTGKKSYGVLYNKATKTYSWSKLGNKHTALNRIRRTVWNKKDAEKLLKVLNAAYKLVSKGWNQAFYAKDAKGHSVDWDSKRAVSYCLAGALLKASKGDWIAEEYINSMFGAVVQYNDDKKRTKEEVLNLLDHARNSLILL